MDSGYDRNALKAVLFATRSRREITELGINAHRAVKFLHYTISAAEESENALEAAGDMLNHRMSKKWKLIAERINDIDAKISKLGDLLPESRKKDLVAEKESLREREKKNPETANS